MTTPIPAEDLPKALAEAMNWKAGHTVTGWPAWWHDGRSRDERNWSPHLSHDHAQLCVEECFKRGLSWEYAKALAGLGHIGCFNGEGVIAVYCLNYSAEMKSRAALAALTGK